MIKPFSCVALALAGIVSFSLVAPFRLPACCPIGRSGEAVVNADQTVVLLWDAAKKTQHFIRMANFKTQGQDFGFLIPSPTRPELAEAGNEVFPLLKKLTEPEIKHVKAQRHSGGCGCGELGEVKSAAAPKMDVQIVESKLVAGFNAVVLAANSSDALLNWLNENGYDFSLAVKDWAQPYVEQGWMITALKVAKATDDDSNTNVDASALRMSFETERPLFLYREPDPGKATAALSANHRTLRIYFIGEARYDGQLDGQSSWSGKLAWSDSLSVEDRSKILDHLNLPADTGSENFWLTEFEDNWAYGVAPADLYFAYSKEQFSQHRPPIIVTDYAANDIPFDVTAGLFVVVLFGGRFLRRRDDDG